LRQKDLEVEARLTLSKEKKRKMRFDTNFPTWGHLEPHQNKLFLFTKLLGE
jgi:hypothetical protein